jgi:hypothetical protein
MALLRARDEGYTPPMIAFDQYDAAARMLRRAAAFIEGDAAEV